VAGDTFFLESCIETAIELTCTHLNTFEIFLYIFILSEVGVFLSIIYYSSLYLSSAGVCVILGTRCLFMDVFFLKHRSELLRQS